MSELEVSVVLERMRGQAELHALIVRRQHAGTSDCVICDNAPQRVKFSPCDHDVFCLNCAVHQVYMYPDSGCPICRSPVTHICE